jgi:hypothetical protein
MADNIVPSLFGIDPEQLNQQRRQEAYAKSLQMAQLGAGQRGAAGLMQAGSALRPALNGMLGLPDVEMQKAQQQQEINKQIDLSTPENIRASAEMLRQKGDFQRAFALSQLANKRESEMLGNDVHKAQIEEYKAKALKDSRPLIKESPEAVRIAEYLASLKHPKDSQEWKDEVSSFYKLNAKEPNTKIIDVGVPGKPGWTQSVEYDPSTKTMTPIGQPKSSAAATRIELGGAQGTVKPKGLSREAGLKWELDNGMIDQSTYDDSMAASPSGKLDAKKKEVLGGKENVSDSISSLRGYYDELNKSGGIVNQDKGSLSNFGASLAASGVGSVVGGAVGTKNETIRQSVRMQRPALLSAIMKATGMNARQMDSNTELKLWLSTATDPQYGYQANMAALDSIERKYGVKGVAPSSENVHPSDIQAILDRQQKRK